VIFVNGIGLDQHSQSVTPTTDLQPTSSCRSASYAFVTLYVLSKVCIHILSLSNWPHWMSNSPDVPFDRSDLQIFVYMFLIERVHVVSSAGRNPPRLSTSTYRFGLVAICVYIAIFVLMLDGRIVELAPPSWVFKPQLESDPLLPPSPVVCTIGLKLSATAPLLAYDVIASVALTAMFVVPLVTVGRVKPHSVGEEQDIPFPEATPPYTQDDLDVPATAGPPPLPSNRKAQVEGMGDDPFLPQYGRVHRERLRSLAKRSCL
jgi:hypothetical protein